MEYTGNQLRKITDESAFDPIYEGAFDYVDYDYSGEQEFSLIDYLYIPLLIMAMIKWEIWYF